MTTNGYTFNSNSKGVEIKKADGTRYQVYVTDSAPTFCTCPAHRMSKDRKPCKHMLAVAALEGLKPQQEQLLPVAAGRYDAAAVR